MDSSNPPAAPAKEAATEAPPPSPAPPPTKMPAMTPEQFARLRGGLDAALVVLVLGFAFLVASFPAYNPDFFRQLASGRLLIRGEYPFGADPFTFSSDGAYRVNHTWLFSLLAYGFYQIPKIGGVAVVVFKALLVAALAAVLLRVGRRKGQSLWLPAACTALAILCVSTGVILQPICLSYLFLALTLWLLRAGRASPRRWWGLPLLFALWVNCDQWFFVGPLAVALYLLGELIHQFTAPAKEGKAGALAVVLAVGVAACLLNPHHYHAFELPAELGLSPAGDRIEHDPQLHDVFLSPLQFKEFYRPNLGLSAAGLAYWPLLLAGAVSFGFLYRRPPWRRLTLWLGFAALSLYSARAIPLFAVVAGPVTALNWLDCAALRLGLTPRLTRGWRQWSLGGRAATIFLLLILLAATVPGWLQAKPWEIHRVGWGVVVDPALEHAARQIHAWREQALLPADTHWFNTYPEVANYLAWFAPDERAFLDQSLPFSPGAADDYLAIRKSLGRSFSNAEAEAEETSGARSSSKRDWRAVLRERGVQFWIYDDRGGDLADAATRFALLGGRDEWKLCYLHGRIAIFAWIDLQTSRQPAARVHPPFVDLNRRAFGSEAEQAPPSGPERVGEEPRDEAWSDGLKDLWNIWWQPKPPTSPDKSAAHLHQMRFEALKLIYFHDHARAWQWATAASAIGNSLPLGPAPNGLLSLSWNCIYEDLFPPGSVRARRQPAPVERVALQAHNNFVASQDTGPVESLYLSIRAARRALRINAEDPTTHLLLARAYWHLFTETQEKFLSQSDLPLSVLRRTQAAAAYQNCLRFHPAPREAFEAHITLFDLFRGQKYLDVAADELRESLNSLRAASLNAGETPTRRAHELEERSKALAHLEKAVKDLQDDFDAKSVNMPVAEQVRMAQSKGLVKSALNVLKNADSKELGVAGALLIGRLFLDLGMVEEATHFLIADPEGMAGQPTWPERLDLLVRLAAARGDYEEADRLFDNALNDVWNLPSGQTPLKNAGRASALLLGRVLGAEALRLGGAPLMPLLSTNRADMQILAQSPTDFWSRRSRLELLKQGLFVSQQRVDWHLQRGWLALERGTCELARKQFRAVIDTVVPPQRWVPEVEGLRQILERQDVNALRGLEAQQNLAWGLSLRYLKWLEDAQR